MAGLVVARQSKTKATAAGANAAAPWQTLAAIFCLLFGVGYLVGYETKDLIFTGTSWGAQQGGAAADDTTSTSKRDILLEMPMIQHKWKGDTIHSVLTSSGDAYQNFQTRIMYGTYKLVQQMPGGEHLTGFTRILHRTVPDVLMEEVPTFHAKPLKPQCDGWCDYPVANRPDAIQQFFNALAANESMVQGAWIFMLECDYVWMRPMQLPGDAWDPTVPGVQFFYDYIIPTHPNCVPHMNKLWPGGDVSKIPASGPAPVLLRLHEWQAIVPDYVKASAIMEADEAMKKGLEWVREMYAWDVAVAMHPAIKVRTEHPPNSTTIVQPPFDEGLGPACLCHYTWGALYHEGLPSKGAKQVYRWEKRDYNDMKHVLKVPNIPMPPPYQDGWILEFDAPLNRKRHDLVVLMLTQMNKAIDTLPDLTEHWQQFEPKLNELIRQRQQQQAASQAGRKRRLMQ